MQSEAPGVARVLLWQRDLREHLLSPLPRGAHALERGPIAESELGETVVEELDVDGLAAGGGPRLGGEAVDGRVGVRGRGREHSARVAGPFVVWVRARMDRERPPARLVGRLNAQLDVR